MWIFFKLYKIMVQKIHPRFQVLTLRLVTCQKKNDNLAVQYEDVHAVGKDWLYWLSKKVSIQNLDIKLCTIQIGLKFKKRRISVAFNCRDELARSIFDQSTMSPSYKRRCRDTTTQIRRSYFFSWPPPFLPLVYTSFRVAKWAGKIKLVRTILTIKFTCQIYRWF